jgi:hypothetical protein
MKDKKLLSLSVIVSIVSGKEHLTACLGELIPQAEAESVEVILPYDASIDYIPEIKQTFPTVMYVDMGAIETEAEPGSYTAGLEIFDLRTSAGLRVASGDILALIRDYAKPSPDYCSEVIRAHTLPHAVIGGAIEHAGRGAVNTAAYYLDFGRYQLPLAEGGAEYLSDANVTYKRNALVQIKDVWEDRYVEVVVNWKLAERGESLWMRPQIVVYQDWGDLRLKELAKERFAWGRLFGSIRIKGASFAKRALLSAASVFVPLLMIGRILLKAVRDGRNRKKLLLCLPQLFVVSYALALGEMLGYITGQEQAGINQ